MKELFHPMTAEKRLPYGAIPLNPWRATQSEGGNNLYSSSSLIRIERKLARTMVEDNWFRDEPRAHALYEFMRGSLFDSQFRRMDKNNLADLRGVDAKEDERAVHALEGTATPVELFTLLADHPEIGSLELAKLSHPFDFGASSEMDRELDELMLTAGGELLDAEPRYKMKRHDESIPAAVLLRKQDLMDFPIEDDKIVRIVERRGLLVFQGEGKEDEPYFDRLLKNEKNHPALFAMTEGYIMTDQPKGRRFGWVQPQATSYYAKVIPGYPTYLKVKQR